eukprot:TRINITY_DN5150_c1_g1_i5.p1 TRINITY_DN5150_c1_g1~~TRINITY_DN5150_c1_g1_i5.p1  ORF type:complete len:212 (-),score=63.55 TRINITY_DN5150_c1_g1_i5:55-660(-)
MDEIFFQGSLPYINEKYQKIPEEKKNNLTFDEFCAVYFYTAQWDDKNLYSLLNASLTSKDYSSTLPQWKYYLHYLLSAIQKIPKWQGSQDLYRGVSQDLVQQYPSRYKEGETITWYAFTSTTTNLKTVKSFLPEDKPSTIFTINGSFSGRCIQDYSAFQTEFEVLLPPGSRFQIISIMKFGNLTIIQIKQTPTFETLLKLE